MRLRVATIAAFNDTAKLSVAKVAGYKAYEGEWKRFASFNSCLANQLTQNATIQPSAHNRTYHSMVRSMSFKTEKLFVTNVLPALESFLPTLGIRHFQISTEVAAGRAIADIVVVASKDDSVRRLPALSIAECVLLCSLRQRGATRIDLLESRCGLAEAGLRSGALDRLLAWNLVRREAGGRISIHKQFGTKIEILAVEAKLKKWRDALHQAEEYRRYANRAFVVLPADESGPATKKSQEFENYGVGLITFDGTALRTVVPARISESHDWRREYVLSRIAEMQRSGDS